MTATLCIFVGPTLSSGEVQGALAGHEVEVRPPVSQGDVYAAVRHHPWGLGIIDGYFERIPAVWHKEILWAMAHGVHVFGSASMGALRAAELASFGMVGVGAIYEAFVSGELEDDDEVTIVHGAGSDYRAGSEAMVNIRATIARAAQEGVLEPGDAEVLIAEAKASFYPDRSYPRLLELCRDRVAATVLKAFRAWLPHGRLDRKRDDALLMLRAMTQRLQAHPQPLSPSFTFQHTDAWEQVRRLIDSRAGSRDLGAGEQDAVLEELRLCPAEYELERERSLTRSLASSLATTDGGAVSDTLLMETGVRLARRAGLKTPVELVEFLERQGVPSDDLETFLTDQARLERVLAIHAGEVVRHLPDQLRVDGKYERLRSRAERKRALLNRQGFANPSLADTGLSETQLWHWFEEGSRGDGSREARRSRVAAPPELVRALDLGSSAQLWRMLVREYVYQRLATALEPSDEGTPDRPPLL